MNALNSKGVAGERNGRDNSHCDGRRDTTAICTFIGRPYLRIYNQIATSNSKLNLNCRRVYFLYIYESGWDRSVTVKVYRGTGTNIPRYFKLILKNTLKILHTLMVNDLNNA